MISNDKVSIKINTICIKMNKTKNQTWYLKVKKTISMERRESTEQVMWSMTLVTLLTLSA
jgi:hypothetical protein